EALKDPDQPQPLALLAPIVRRNLQPQVLPADPQPAPTVNLLIVVARPGGKADVGYRTISRPLVETLRQAALRVRVEILRPGTYPALAPHLDAVPAHRGAGYHHVIHFDPHGSLLSYDQFEKGAKTDRLLYQTRYARGDLERYEGRRAFLAFEGTKEGQSDL